MYRFTNHLRSCAWPHKHEAVLVKPWGDRHIGSETDQQEFISKQIQNSGWVAWFSFGHTVRISPLIHSASTPVPYSLRPLLPNFILVAGNGRLVNSVVARTSRSLAGSRLPAFSNVWPIIRPIAKPPPSISLAGG